MVPGSVNAQAWRNSRVNSWLFFQGLKINRAGLCKRAKESCAVVTGKSTFGAMENAGEFRLCFCILAGSDVFKLRIVQFGNSFFVKAKFAFVGI